MVTASTPSMPPSIAHSSATGSGSSFTVIDNTTEGGVAWPPAGVSVQVSLSGNGLCQAIRSAWGSVALPGFSRAARRARSRYALGSTPQSFADSIRL